MNRQVEYITYAHLLLIVAAGGFFFIRTISPQAESTSSFPAIATKQTSEVSLAADALEGKNIFVSKCQGCHTVFREITGPALGGFESRGPWSDRTKLYEWIRNPQNFMTTDDYTRSLKQKYGLLMTGFPSMTEKQMDQVVSFINESYTAGKK